MHMITGGCVLTRIEQRLTGDNLTIVDPLLEIFNIPKTRKYNGNYDIIQYDLFYYIVL